MVTTAVPPAACVVCTGICDPLSICAGRLFRAVMRGVATVLTSPRFSAALTSKLIWAVPNQAGRETNYRIRRRSAQVIQRHRSIAQAAEHTVRVRTRGQGWTREPPLPATTARATGRTGLRVASICWPGYRD